MATAAISIPRRRRRGNLAGARGRVAFPEVHFVKRIDNSRLRREVNPEKRRECFRLLALGVLVFLIGFYMAWQHFQCVRYGYQIEQLKAQRASLEQWNHELRLEQAALVDPQRIDRLARSELGLRPPGPQQVIRVKPAAEPPAAGDVVLARNVLGPRLPLVAVTRGQ